MYTIENFKTKKAMREAFKAGVPVRVFQPGPFGGGAINGDVSVEGPHYPKPHRWYATVQVVDGQIVKILG